MAVRMKTTSTEAQLSLKCEKSRHRLCQIMIASMLYASNKYGLVNKILGI